MGKISDIEIKAQDFDDINNLNIFDNDNLHMSSIYDSINSILKAHDHKSYFNLLDIFGVITHFYLDNSSKEVFKSRYNINMSCFSKEQIAIFYHNINKINNLALKARILDIIYESKLLNKDLRGELHNLLLSTYDKLCNKYTKYDSEKITYCIRLLMLTYILDNVADSLQIRNNLIASSLELSLHFCLLFYKEVNIDKIQKDQLSKIISYLKSFISKLDKDLCANQDIYDLLISLDKDNRKDYKLKKAKNYENMAKISHDSAFIKTHLLKEAQKIYREEGENTKKNKIQKEIDNLKPLIVDEMVSNSIKISKDIKEDVYKNITLPLREALSCMYTDKLYHSLFCFFNNIIFPSKEEIDSGEKSFMDLGIPISIYNSMGTKIAYKNNKDYSYLQEINTSFSVGILSQQIHYGLLILNEEFFFSEHDILILISHNQYCENQTQSITKGIYAFLKQDYITASYLLIPQIEEYLRRKLKADGVNIVAVKNNGVEKPKIELKDLITQCEERLLIGSIDAFWLKRFLLEDSTNIRNILAHGNFTDNELFRGDVICLLYIFIKKLVKHNFSLKITS
jgi:hypothetical protein